MTYVEIICVFRVANDGRGIKVEVVKGEVAVATVVSLLLLLLILVLKILLLGSPSHF